MNLPFLSAARRAWGWVADPQHNAASRQGDAAVAALCLCVLGEHEEGVVSRWPPQSLDELTRSVSGTPRGIADGTLLLQQGLAAVDDLAMDETGARFCE